MRSGIFNIGNYARVLWLALTIFFSISSVTGQHISTRHFTIKCGFPSMGIRGVFNISGGDMREAPHAGLIMYDNTIFTHTIISEGLPKSSAGNVGINSGKYGQLPGVYIQIHQPWYGLWYIQIITLLLFLITILIINRKTISHVKSAEKRKAELEKKITNLEIQALQAQISPHFIFNSINNIQYFVLSNKTDEVLSYLSDFSKVVRASLTNVSQKMIPLGGIIDFLNSYLRIEKMRFPDKFEFRVEMLGQLDPLSIMMPPYLIQPFAENAVKQSFMHNNSTGHLSITFEKAGDEIMKCTIIDNGVGRAKALEIEDFVAAPIKTHSIEISEARIQLFNTPKKPDRYKVIYTNLIDSKGNSSGLKVEVYLPIENV